MSYPRLVQPVWDRHCVRCHDGTEGPGKSPPVLTSQPAEGFSRSYVALKPSMRWYEWGGATIEPIATRPGRLGADASPLVAVLNDANHSENVNLSDQDWRRIFIWLDANAPFYGTYGEAEQRSIYGEASPEEAKQLHEEGIEFHPLPILPDDNN